MRLLPQIFMFEHVPSWIAGMRIRVLDAQVYIATILINPFVSSIFGVVWGIPFLELRLSAVSVEGHRLALIPRDIALLDTPIAPRAPTSTLTKSFEVLK